MLSDPVYLRRIDPERHMARFYALAVDRDLFGQVLLMRQWGRIGMSCRVRHDPARARPRRAWRSRLCRLKHLRLSSMRFR